MSEGLKGDVEVSESKDQFTLYSLPITPGTKGGRPRCKLCGFKVRGANHAEGKHHQGRH